MNAIVFATTMTALMRTHIILFVLYFVLNVLDLLTGIAKGHSQRVFNSKTFSSGVGRKVLLWITILLAFIANIAFEQVGSVLGFDFGITKLLGWFVLSAFIFQEIRSVVENLIALGLNVPSIFTKALAIAERELDGAFDGVFVVDTSNPDKDVYRMEFDGPLDSLAGKDKVTFKVKKADG